jgi:hypothetical protein
LFPKDENAGITLHLAWTSFTPMAIGRRLKKPIGSRALIPSFRWGTTKVGLIGFSLTRRAAITLQQKSIITEPQFPTLIAEERAMSREALRNSPERESVQSSAFDS